MTTGMTTRSLYTAPLIRGVTKPTAEDKKMEIINAWLAGNSRDDIALKAKVSGGTVSKVIEEFRRFSYGNLDVARQLATEMKRHGLTFADAAAGVRRINQLKAISIDEEDVFVFVKNLHSSLISNGVVPREAANLLTELAQLSNNTRLAPSKVPSFLKEKLDQVGLAEKKLAEIRMQRDKEEKMIATLKNEKKEVTQGLQEFLVSKEKLSRVGVSISDAESVGRLVQNAIDFGFDPVKIVTTLNNTERLKAQESSLQYRIADLETKMTNVQSNLLAIGIKAAGYQAAIPYIEQLRSCSIDPLSVSTACSLLLRYGLDLIELEKDLAEYHELKAGLIQLGHKGQEMMAENLRLWKENVDLREAKQSIEAAIQVWNQDGKQFLEALNKEAQNLLKERADEIMQKHIEMLLVTKDKTIAKYLDSKFAPLVVAEYEGVDKEDNRNYSFKVLQATIAALAIAASLPTLKKEAHAACMEMAEVLKGELVTNQ